ncbi:hypothetical protein SmJEL517_g01565 [Synchytrium microbalum]|uniref:GST N-terminal domain-containing protein n=1 Tax=Synchytrium microbalum TaxID=1806994 RepID=A0A507C9E5_9FUNG|nr:uncharacterized protein SmJEL517_g01565 [Synchytrium microbalum]TPX36222.1 hypothetical protein SmJEL517_g01565 [Synchytrium microbalum]
MKPIILYDLCAKDTSVRFSPYVWRTKLALEHKQIPYETVSSGFTDKPRLIALSKQDLVPVIVDPNNSDKVVSDSWKIAEYLESQYPDKPSLFGGDAGTNGVLFIQKWWQYNGIRPIGTYVIVDVWKCISDKDAAFFRAGREKLLKKTLEDVEKGRENRVKAWRPTLRPLKDLLREQSFIGGKTPNYSDYIVFAAFQWARCVSDFQLLEKDTKDPIYNWRERMLDLYGGLARKAPTVTPSAHL